MASHLYSLLAAACLAGATLAFAASAHGVPVKSVDSPDLSPADCTAGPACTPANGDCSGNNSCGRGNVCGCVANPLGDCKCKQ